jgi:replicative DNA helicase
MTKIDPIKKESVYDIMKREEALKNYHGIDEVVWAAELKEELIQKSKEVPEVSMKFGFPTLDENIHYAMGGELIVVSGPTKHGKCESGGTKLLMFDGTIKKIEDVEIGDLLMGDDSTPRTVLSLARGRGELFKIIPWQGDSYSCNKEHILCLQRTRTKVHRTDGRKPDQLHGQIREIAVQDYLNLSKGQKHILKTYRVPVSFPEKPLPIPPYLLGLWLGDGSSHEMSITTADVEIVDYLKQYCGVSGFTLTQKHNHDGKANLYRVCKGNMCKILRENGLIKNKHIPYIFKCNSEKNRLELLAGLIDTDGNFVKSTRGGALEYVSKSKVLIDDVAYLCRSLGFACTPHKTIKKIKSLGFEGEYWTMRISGDTTRIPCLVKRKVRNGMKPFKNVLRSSFKIEPDGVGEYYGFTLDGNGRYLHADFQVTHNTLFCQTLTRNFFSKGVGSLWFSYEVPGLQFLEQFGQKMPSFVLPKVLKESSYPWIIDRIYEAKLKYGIQAVFIDNTQNVLNLMSHQLAQLVGEFVKAIKRTAIDLNIAMFLLHHFTKVKLEDNEAMDSSCMRDSSLVAQTADTVFLIRRDNDQILHPKKSYVKVTENRRFGVMNLIVPMQKVGYYLEEESYDEREQPDYHERQ